MTGWYRKLASDPDDLSSIPEIVEHFETEIADALGDLKVQGRRLEEVSKQLPELMTFRFNQLQEVEAILKLLNLKLDRARGRKHRHYMEKYDRALSSRDAEKYADADDDVFVLALLCNEISLIRNQYLGITKGLESLGYQMRNAIEIRKLQIEDEVF